MQAAGRQCMSTHSGRPRALLIGAVLFAAVVVLAEAPPARAGRYYTATPLPTLGGTSTQGYGINDRGQITGRSYIAGNAAVHAFLYSGGAMTDLGTLGGTNSEGRGINNAGQVTGWAQRRGSEPHAFLYSAGTMSDLGTLGGTHSAGYGINDSGQVTGDSSIYAPSVLAAFLYTGGAMTSLPVGHVYNHALDINNSGQVVGWGSNPGTPWTWAFLYSDGAITQLSSGKPAGSKAYGINDRGQVTGGQGSAWVYSDGSMTDLGTLGGAYSAGYAINDRGQVVGSSYTSANVSFHAFVYADGTMVDLNSVVVSGLGGATLTEARGINDDGQIIANACSDPYPDPGSTFSCTAFLLDPVVEEATQVPTLSGSALVAMAVLLLAGGILRVGEFKQ